MEQRVGAHENAPVIFGRFQATKFAAKDSDKIVADVKQMWKPQQKNRANF